MWKRWRKKLLTYIWYFYFTLLKNKNLYFSMKSTMKVDAWRNCTARQEASFWKGRGGGRLIQNFLTSKDKKITKILIIGKGWWLNLQLLNYKAIKAIYTNPDISRCLHSFEIKKKIKLKSNHGTFFYNSACKTSRWHNFRNIIWK